MTNEKNMELLLERIDGSGSDDEWSAIKELRTIEALPRLLLEKFRTTPKWKVRSSCVYHSVRYARTSDDALALGKEAISDKAKVVRYRGCMLLAYSQRREVLPTLERAMKTAKKREDLADLRAAIDAIESGNHNFFVDRHHSGKVTLTIS